MICLGLQLVIILINHLVHQMSDKKWKSPSHALKAQSDVLFPYINFTAIIK